MFAVHSSSRPSIIVVGAGPAGSTAARALALGGVQVTILDRAAFPRNKPCGGGVSIRALRRFPHLADQLPRIATHTVSRLYLEGPGGQSATVEADRPAALMIRRVEFDALLLDLALDAGATLVSGVDVIQARSDATGVHLTSRDGRRFSAPLVIAADGVHSVVARRLGLRSGWPAASVALDMMEETPRELLRDVDPSTLWVAYGYRPSAGGAGASAPASNAAAEGYAYIFPKRDHVNIGIGYVLSYYRQQVGTAPYDLQRQFVETLRARGVVQGDSVHENFTPFLIPVGGPVPKPGRGRVLLAGDAGGFVNGFTAEGIYYAMVSGDLAAGAVIDAGPSLDRAADLYCAACERELGPELRDSVLLQRYLFSSRRRIAAAIAGAQRQTRITRLILDLAFGERPYRDVRRRMLAHAPHLALALLWARLTQRCTLTPSTN